MLINTFAGSSLNYNGSHGKRSPKRASIAVENKLA